MNKNAWITLIGVVIVLVSLALVLMLILVPQSSAHITGISYDAVQKNDFDFSGTKYDPQKEENIEKHEVNSAQIRGSEKEGFYEPGNKNPFTPKKDITVYNEPGFTPTSSNAQRPSGNSTGSTPGTKGNADYSK